MKDLLITINVYIYLFLYGFIFCCNIISIVDRHKITLVILIFNTLNVVNKYIIIL